MVGELAVKSADFRELWAKHPFLDRTYGTKRLRHQLFGDLDLSFETLELPGDQVLAVYTATKDSSTEERLRLLASWVAASLT